MLLAAALVTGLASGGGEPSRRTGQEAVQPVAAVRSSGPAAAVRAALPLAGRVVALDPGHQLGNSRFPDEISRRVWVGLWKQCNTTGTATDGGFPEATFTWRVTRRVLDHLEALGATVRLTRTANSWSLWGPCIDQRGRFGARVGADLMVSLHGDGSAPSTHGFFVIRPGLRAGYTDDVLAPSARLARRLRAGLTGAGLHVSTA